MPELYTEITKDRAGGKGELIPILSMGEIYLNAYPNKGEVHSHYPKAPIDLVWNQDSCLLQNKQTVSRKALYDEYWYVSGLNETMVKHLRDVVRFAHKYGPPLGSKDIVVDIASNDGTLLRQYEEVVGPKVDTVGYDPAINLSDKASGGVDCHFPICFDANHFTNHFDKKAKIITACAVIYHIPDLVKFMEGVAEVLDKDGVFVCEFAYLPTIVKNNAFDAIGHEHITHLSLTSLGRIVKNAGLEIIKVQLGDINSGTALCVIKHSPNHYNHVDDLAWVSGLKYYESCLNIPGLGFYKNWAKRGLEIRERLGRILEEWYKQGKTVYLYGASTKASILLQWVQQVCTHPMSELIQKAVERDTRKIGKTMVSLKIPIITEEEARRNNPDIMFVGPWCFKEAFLEREKDYLKNGGQMVFPFPEVEVHTG